MQRLLVCSAAAATVATVYAPAASAQNYAGTQPSILQNFDRGRNVSVLQRERPEYAAQGLLIGGFTVFPKMTLGLTSDSNVYAAKSDTVSDTYFKVTPRVDIYSNWSRHQAQAQASYDLREYFNESSENQRGWFVNGVGRLDIVGESYIQGGGQLRREYLERSDVGFPTTAAKPIAVLTSNLFARGVYQSGRLRGAALFTFDRRDFKDVRSTSGGTLEQDSRDVDIFAITGRGDYALTSSTAAFGQATYRSYRYIESGPFERNSHETEALVGANFDLTALVRGEIGAGYLSKEYDSPQFKGISGLSFTGRLEYFPTPLTTVTVTGRRAIQDSILANTGGYISTAATLRVDHELRRNVLLAATVSADDQDFRGADRKDRVYSGVASARYLLNSSLGVGASATYHSRQSSGALKGPEFDDTLLAVSLTFQR